MEDPFTDFRRPRGTDFDRFRASSSERAVSMCSGSGTHRDWDTPKPKKLEKCSKVCDFSMPKNITASTLAILVRFIDEMKGQRRSASKSGKRAFQSESEKLQGAKVKLHTLQHFPRVKRQVLRFER